MKLGIIGSRTFNNYNLLVSAIQEENIVIDLIVSGGAPGADSLGEKYADENKIPKMIIKPNWNLGKHAGFLRNHDIIKNSDYVLVFWDGKSKGTAHSISLCKSYNVKYKIINF